MRRLDFLDTSKELIVQRWGRGVKLVRPDVFYSSILADERSVAPPSVGNLFEMPFNVYFLNTQNVIQNISEKTANICGFDGQQEALGNTAFAVYKKESAEATIRKNHEVISRNSIVIQEGHFFRKDDFGVRAIAIKFPLLSSEGKVIGIFGCSTIIEALTESFLVLMNTGLLAATGLIEQASIAPNLHIGTSSNQQECKELVEKLSKKLRQPISSREGECLFYLIRGKSARETGVLLNLSQRTVEFYLATLKDKLNCRKKSEIIDNVFNLLRTNHAV